MPKIVRFHQIGGPENLKFEDVPIQQPGPGEVRLRVKAIGLNRAEVLYMRGQYLEQPKLPSRIGYEAAGVVEAVGEGVERSWIGKHAASVPGFSMNQYGLLGEEAIVPAGVLGEYPEKLSSIEAAAIWTQYMTGYGALVHYGKLTAGDFVIITAASSSVGLAAIEVARVEGATAIATTRSYAKRDELLSLGAHHVIATEEEDLVERVQVITGGKGARVIFDPVAGPIIEKLAEAAAMGGIIFEYGLLSQQPTPFPLMVGFVKGLSVRAYTVHEIVRDPTLFEAGKKYIYDRLDDGRFHPKIAKTFPFDQTVEAYKYLESNAQVGKIVITM